MSMPFKRSRYKKRKAVLRIAVIIADQKGKKKRRKDGLEATTKDYDKEVEPETQAGELK